MARILGSSRATLRGERPSPKKRRWRRWVAGSSSASVGSNRTPPDSYISLALGQSAVMGWRTMAEEKVTGSLNTERISR